MNEHDLVNFLRENLQLEFELEEAGYYDTSHCLTVRLILANETISETSRYLPEITPNMQNYFKRDDSSY